MWSWVQVAVQFLKSVRFAVRISTGGWTCWVCPVPCQNSWQRSPRWRHCGRCRQFSSSRNEADAKASETFLFLCPSLDSQVHYFLGTCEAHHPTSFCRNKKNRIAGGPTVTALASAHFAILAVHSVGIPEESVCFRQKGGCKKMEGYQFHSGIPYKVDRKP